MIPVVDTAKVADTAARWLIAIVVWLLWSALLFWSGWTIKSNAVDAAKLKTVTVQLGEAHAQAEADRDEYIWRLGVDAKVRDDKAAKAHASRAAFQQIREEIPHVAKPVPTALPAVDCPVCSCRYGPDFIRVWNDALEAGASTGVSGATDGPHDAAARPDSTETVDAVDILANHADNAEVNAANRQNCQAILDWHAQQKKRKAAQ